MSGKGCLNLDDLLERLGGERVISIPGSGAESRAELDIASESLELSTSTREKYDEAEFNRASMTGLFDSYTELELLKRQEDLFQYGQIFAEFTESRELIDFLANFERYYAETFALQEQLLLLEIKLKFFLEKVLEQGRRYGRFFPIYEARYNTLSDEQKLDYLYSLCNDFNQKYPLRSIQENLPVLLKDIIKTAIKNYYQHGKNLSFIQSLVITVTPSRPLRIELNYLKQLQELIEECEGCSDIFQVLGYFYNSILPTTEHDFKKKVSDEYAFSAFFLQELSQHISNNPIVICLVENIIRKQAVVKRRPQFEFFQFLFISNYHAEFSRIQRENWVKALCLFDGHKLVDKLIKIRENKERDSYVNVEEQDIASVCNM